VQYDLLLVGRLYLQENRERERERESGFVEVMANITHQTTKIGT